MNKTTLAILKVLDRHYDIIGSREISRQLILHGIDLTERTVRYHLKILDARGYTNVFKKEGRRITEKGRQEMNNALVSDKLGFIISKIDNLSSISTLDPLTLEGTAILNVSYFPQKYLDNAIEILSDIFTSSYVISDKANLAKEGQRIGDIRIPEGMAGLGTICSVTINGMFLKEGIPVTSRFGGIVEILNDKPKRFLSLISYEGSSLDPHEIFIKSRMTDVVGAVRNHTGKILASFREIPVACIDRAIKLVHKITEANMAGVFLIGEPNQPLLEIPVGIDKAGLLFLGGLNPVAALEEFNIPTESHAMSVLHEYKKLKPFNNHIEEAS